MKNTYNGNNTLVRSSFSNFRNNLDILIFLSERDGNEGRTYRCFHIRWRRLERHCLPWFDTKIKNKGETRVNHRTWQSRLAIRFTGCLFVLCLDATYSRQITSAHLPCVEARTSRIWPAIWRPAS